MPSLKLGLGLDRQSNYKDVYRQLISQNAKLILSAPKASGTSPLTGVQSPWVDLSKNGNNAVGSNFGGTQTSGWVTDILACDTGVEHNVVNLLGNDGNFGVDSNVDGLADGWGSLNLASKSILANEQRFTASAQYGQINETTKIRNQSVSDKIYICAFVTANVTSVRIGFNEGTGGGFIESSHSASVGTTEFLSVLGTLFSKLNATIYVSDIRTSGWDLVKVNKAHVLNLTTIFANGVQGTGKEPTQAQMDRLVQWMIARFGYINTKVLKLAWRSMQRLDGTDDLDSIANSASMDLGISGKEQMFSVLARVPIGATSGFFMSKNATLSTDIQYALAYDSVNKRIDLWLNGAVRASTPNNSILENEFYNVSFHRNAVGLITPWINKVAQATSTYSGNLTTQANVRLGCRANNASFLKLDSGASFLYEFTTLDANKIKELEWKIARDYIYTGV